MSFGKILKLIFLTWELNWSWLKLAIFDFLGDFAWVLSFLVIFGFFKCPKSLIWFCRKAKDCLTYSNLYLYLKWMFVSPWTHFQCRVCRPQGLTHNPLLGRNADPWIWAPQLCAVCPLFSLQSPSFARQSRFQPWSCQVWSLMQCYVSLFLVKIQRFIWMENSWPYIREETWEVAITYQACQIDKNSLIYLEGKLMTPHQEKTKNFSFPFPQ